MGLNLVKKKYREEIVGDYPYGYGKLIQYWDNGKVKFIHRTYDDGSWYKHYYDENGKKIYYEDSDDYWEKWEHDENGNSIYYETSYGFWSKHEYDKNGNVIYYETSNGYVEDNRPQNINEGLNLVSKKKYREIIMGNYPDGEGQLIQYWDNGKIKFEHKTFDDGSWRKYNYNENGYWIGYEDSNGYWSKREYDKNEHEIYYENSDGIIRDYRSQNVNEQQMKKIITEILTPADISQIKAIAASEANKIKNELKPDVDKAIKDITKHTQEKNNHLKNQDVKELIKVDIDKIKEKQSVTDEKLSNVEKSIDDKINKFNNSKDLEEKMKELVTDVMVKYHQTLWVKRGFWTNGLTK